VGPLLCGWHVCPGSKSGRRRTQKNGSDPDEPEDHALGRSRGGWGTKVHIVADGQGTPLAVEVSPGEVHESTQFESVMDAVRIPRPQGRPKTRPAAVAGDKGYSCLRIRKWLEDRKIEDVIPTKENEYRRPHFDREKYRQRNVVERCIGWLKEARRVGTRFEKLAVNFVAMLKLSMINRYLRLCA
jgi:transposase